MLPAGHGIPRHSRSAGVDRILLTNRHHYRHSDRLAAALGCPVLCHEAGLHEFEGGPEVHGFAFGEEVAPGIVAREVGVICPEETALHIQHGRRRDRACRQRRETGPAPGWDSCRTR